MPSEFKDFVNSLGMRSPRSKLEPYREDIRDLRRKGFTYRAIAAFFAEKLHFTVAPSTLHNFVKVRSKVRKSIVMVEEKPAPAVQSKSIPGKSPITEPVEEKRRFNYQPGEPLRLSKVRDGK